MSWVPAGEEATNVHDRISHFALTEDSDEEGQQHEELEEYGQREEDDPGQADGEAKEAACRDEGQKQEGHQHVEEGTDARRGKGGVGVEAVGQVVVAELGLVLRVLESERAPINGRPV